MLSKPWSDSSAGSNDSASMSSPSKSRTALLYSNRFRRCSEGLPAFGCATASESSSLSKCAKNASKVALSGRGIPAGGMAPLRTFCTTFSQTSAAAPRCEMSI